MTHLPGLASSDAGQYLTEARHLLDDAAATADLASALAWESPAADAYRDELARCRARMAADADVLAEVRSVVARAS
jgi:uncharacterized protein YukE